MKFISKPAKAFYYVFALFFVGSMILMDENPLKIYKPATVWITEYILTT